MKIVSRKLIQGLEYENYKTIFIDHVGIFYY